MTRTIKEYNVNGERLCSNCKKFKNILEFNKGHCTDGLAPYCRVCTKNYYIKNKYRLNKLSMKNYYTNREKRLEQANKYYKDNKEELCIKNRKRYHNNKIANKENRKEYYKNNKEYIKAKSVRNRKVQAKYETYYKQLTIDESSRLAEDGIHLEVKCRYCGKYFIPTTGTVGDRIKKLNDNGGGECSLYCSDSCKESCPIYKRLKYPKGFKKASSREVNPLVRQLCFERDNWVCQICGATQEEAPLHCHHIEGVAQNPRLSNDVKNTITLCKDCHKEVHRLPGCNYYELQCKKGK